MYKKSILTDDEKYMQTQLQLERELAKLRREFASIHLSHSYESSALQKTNKVVSLFSKQRRNLLDDLKVATNKQKKKEDAKVFDTLNGLLDELNDSQASVTKYKVYIVETEIEIKLVKKSVQELRKQQISDRQYEERVWEAIKTVEALENKLEVQMRKFGEICSKNRLLRSEVDHLLCERKVFLKQWDSFIHKLCKGKKIMMDLIEQATIAFNQREEWCNKLQALRTKAHQDLLQNMDAMRNYKRKHDNSLKLEGFFMIKGQKRILRDLAQQMRERAKKRLEETEQKLEAYCKILMDIQNFTKETEIESVAKKFATQEELNLSYFKYIIDSIGEMEIVNENLIAYHLDIEEQTLQHQRYDFRQKSNLIDLEFRLQDAIVEAQFAQNQLDVTCAQFDGLLRGVDTLFKISKCNNDPILQLLGDHTSIKDYNVSLYLEVLEEQIQLLLITAGYREKLIASDKKKYANARELFSTEESLPTILSIDKIITTTPCSLCVEHDMVADVIDVLQTVYTRDQIKRKLKFRLTLPEGLATVHNISKCHLPKSRGLLQKRYE